MIAGVPAEKPCAGGFSDEETEQVEIEASARLEVCRVETKVAEPANLKRAVQGNTADVVFGRIHHCHDNLSSRLFLETRSQACRTRIVCTISLADARFHSATWRYHSRQRRRKNERSCNHGCCNFALTVVSDSEP